MGSPTGRGRLRDTDHLTTEAVVAYVDGELAVGAHQRASGHLAACEQCTLEVHAQQQARAALRTSGPVSMPSSLLGALCRIPDAWDTRRSTLRGATPGQPLAVDASPVAGTVVFSAHSGYVAVLRPDDFDPDLPPTAGDEPGEHAAGERRAGEHAAGEHGAGEHGAGEQPGPQHPGPQHPGRGRRHRRILPFAVVAVAATAGLLVAASPARTAPAAAATARVVQTGSALQAAPPREDPADADFTGRRAG